MWFLVLMLYLAGPYVDVAVPTSVGPFSSQAKCLEAREQVRTQFGGMRGLSVVGVCVPQ